jgi:hypothetical protein
MNLAVIFNTAICYVLAEDDRAEVVMYCFLQEPRLLIGGSYVGSIGHCGTLCGGRVEMLETGFRRVRRIAKSDYQLRHVCPSARKSAPTGRIFMKIYICVFFEILSRNIQVSLKSDNNNLYFT